VARFGLIGKHIDYSFSRSYFREKFSLAKLGHTYENFDLPNDRSVETFLENLDGISGLNVTIPYKQVVMPLLDEIDPVANRIGAVNTIAIDQRGRTKGFNTDHIGFSKALEEYLPLAQPKALVLGSGGASKAVVYALEQMKIPALVVSRGMEGDITYRELDTGFLASHSLLVNCTPLGTSPDINRYPDIPYELLSKDHLLFDLVYNPSVTRFMELGKEQGARVCNGYRMLVEQAEAAWNIWSQYRE
jgi:shikimate dehydrogenase